MRRLGRERRAHSRPEAGESPLRGHQGRGRRARAWTHTRVLISQGSFGSRSCRSAQKVDETRKLMGPGPQGAPRPPVRILARSSHGQRATWPPASGAAAKQAGQRGRRDLALAREDCCVQRRRGSLPAISAAARSDHTLSLFRRQLPWHARRAAQGHRTVALGRVTA